MSVARTKESPKVLMRGMAQVEFEGRKRTIAVCRTASEKQGLPWALAYPAVDELNQRHRTNVKIIGPHLAEKAVSTNGEVRGTLDFGDYFLVDQALFFEAHGKPIGKSIVSEYEDPQARYYSRMAKKGIDIRNLNKGHTFRASLVSTGKYEGRKGIALVVIGLSTADFSVDIPEIGSGKLVELLQHTSLGEIVEKLRKGETVIRETAVDVPDSRLIEVPGFRFWGSLYSPLHLETMIPHVRQRADEIIMRRLCLKKGRPSAGSIIRGVGSFGYDSRENMISTVHGIATPYGIVLEIPDADLGKFAAATRE